MKVKTTQSIFSQKDFGISVVSAAASKCFMFAILLFAFSNSGFAQSYPANGLVPITAHRAYVDKLKSNPGLPYTNKLSNNPFDSGKRNSRTQMLFTFDEFFEYGAEAEAITKISFRLHATSGQVFAFEDFTIKMGSTVLSNFENTQLPPADASLITVRTGSLSFTRAELDANNGWITIPVTAFPYTGIGNLIVEVSKTVGVSSYNSNGTPKFRLSVYTPEYNYDKGPKLVRGCNSSNNNLIQTSAVNMYTTDSKSPNTATDGFDPEVRTFRPFVTFTNKASLANSSNAIYSTSSSSCIGEDIIVTASNLYASGYDTYQWFRSTVNGASTNYVSIDGGTEKILTTNQPAEKTFYRLFVTSDGSGYFAGESFGEVDGVKAYREVTPGVFAWDNGTPPSLGESAYYATNSPLSWPDGVDEMYFCGFSVAPGKIFTVPAGKTLRVDHKFRLEDIAGTIVFEDGASLIQNTDKENEGINTIYKRITQPIYKFDYTYYSSPVKGAVLNDVSPNTLPDKFLSWSPDTNDWFYENKLNLMAPGKGYAIRGPQNLPTVADKTNFNANFQGTPNNGDIPVTLTNLVGGYNLIGNPYPSAVDASLFTRDNSNLEGTIYLWNHNTPIGSVADGMQYSPADYITSNLMGTNEGPNSPIVAAGQSFMIKTASVPTPPNTDPVIATWTNQMRIEGENGLNNFYKVQSPNLNAYHIQQASAAGRFWLELKSNSGISQKMLVGYIQGATAGYDRLYDGETISSGALNIYGFADEKYLAILANGLPFNNEEVLPIGFKTGTAGNHTITKFLQDGFFENYAVYINDKLTNTVHNLSESNYTFTSTVGTFNERFVIAYKIKEPIINENPIIPNRVIVFDKYDNVHFHSGQEIMSNIIVYDLSGRILARAENCNSTEVALSNLPRKNQLLIVEIHLENGNVETQKFRF